MQREGRTRPYKWHHEKVEGYLTDQRWEAQLAQEKAEEKKQDALDRARAKAALARANLVVQEETAIRAAFADYRQRFLAKHGQAVWDKGIGGTSNQIGGCLVHLLEELMARPAPTAL